jgi:hypothetical protein
MLLQFQAFFLTMSNDGDYPCRHDSASEVDFFSIAD